jgi:gamma-glutamyltranspeptidase/glutathione hydrolase
VQKNLAKSLELIAEHGPDAFYKGSIDQIAEMRKNGGLITKADLANYKAVERTPSAATIAATRFSPCRRPFRGIHIVQILNILENFDMQNMASAARILAGDGGGGKIRLCRPV